MSNYFDLFRPFVDQPCTVPFWHLCLACKDSWACMLACDSRLIRSWQPVGQFHVDWHFYYAYSINSFMAHSSRHRRNRRSKLKMCRHWILFWMKYAHWPWHFRAQRSIDISPVLDSAGHRPKEVRTFPHLSNV